MAFGLRNDEIRKILIGSEGDSGSDSESADSEKRLVRNSRVFVGKECGETLAHLGDVLRDFAFRCHEKGG